MGRRRPQLARKNGLLGLGSCPGSKHGDRGQHYSKQIPTLTAADEDRAGSHEGLVLIVKLREREGQGVDPGRSLRGHLWMVDGGYPFPRALH